MGIQAASTYLPLKLGVKKLAISTIPHYPLKVGFTCCIFTARDIYIKDTEGKELF